MLFASVAVTTVLACTQMILKFNAKVKSQLGRLWSHARPENTKYLKIPKILY